MTSMPRDRRPLAIGLALVLGAGLPAAQAGADEARLSLNGAFREAFSAGPVSGTRSNRTVETLVGVRIGNPETTFDAASLRVGLGQAEARGPICLRLIARDGRYSASATYQTASVRGLPSVEAPTRYADQLKAYRATDMAVVAFVAPGCDMAKASELYAVLHGPVGRTNVLAVQVNSSASRTRAQLSQSGRPLGDVTTCPPVEGGPRIGFTSECGITLENATPGNYTLTLIETTSSGASQTRSYPLRIVKASDT